MAEDALKCFNNFLDSVPGLLEELDSIVKNSKEKAQEELERQQPAREPIQLRKRPSRSSSLQSRHSRDGDSLQPPVERSNKEEQQASQSSSLQNRHPASVTPAEFNPQPTDPPTLQDQLPHLTDADALRLAQRKRKTMSARSGRASGPLKYRSRDMIVVYYDGEVQKRFEAVVRSIGLCRNSMRKGKMSAKVDLLSRSGSSSGEESLDEGVTDIGVLTPRLRQPRVLPKDDETQAFDKADSFLDKAQALCERAAHQVLRDGDCALEINNAKENIASALKIGQDELPGLQKRAAKAAERQRKDEEQRERREERKRSKDESVNEAPDADGRLGSPASMVLEVDDMEADDSDGDADPPIPDVLQYGKFRIQNVGRFCNRVPVS